MFNMNNTGGFTNQKSAASLPKPNDQSFQASRQYHQQNQFSSMQTHIPFQSTNFQNQAGFQNPGQRFPNPSASLPPTGTYQHNPAFYQHRQGNSAIFQGNSADRQKFMEERKKFEQQQKLKAFSKVGVKPSIDADAFMKNLIGPTPSASKVESLHQQEQNNDDSFGDFVGIQPETNLDTGPTNSNPSQNDDILEKHSTSEGRSQTLSTTKPQLDPKKGLESMIEKFSDFSMSGKAGSFKQKVTTKEAHLALSKSEKYNQSNKACNWSKVSVGVGVSFVTPSSSVVKPEGYPGWCIPDKVPDLYRQVEACVSSPEGLINTGLLYPLLMSSGLPQPLLGYIWGLTNKTTPGQLTQPELYLTLALIALAQAGQTFQNTDVLSSLPQPPIPCFATAQQQQPNQEQGSVAQHPNIRQDSPAIAHPTSIDCVNESQVEDQPQILTEPKILSGNYRRAAMDNIHPKQDLSYIQGQSLLNMAGKHNEDTQPDEFDDFVSAAPKTETIPSKKVEDDNDFAEFQFATAPGGATTDKPDVKLNTSDLMSMDQDKYGALRDLLGPETSETANEAPSVIEPEANLNTVFESSEAPKFVADFSQFQETNADPILSNVPNLPKETQLPPDVEWGMFDSIEPPKNESLFIDSQSIASLDFSGYDQERQSSESKSPVSKSESIPSLDLKGIGNELKTSDEDDFGEMVSADNNSKTKSHPVDASVLLQNSSKERTVIDKYSSVRLVEDSGECEDVHVNEWLKCLRSCDEILKNANSIFNGISCSAVCNEVIATEEGSLYFRNVIEVYRVARRLALSIKTFHKFDTEIDKVLKDINLVWNNLIAFISGTPIMPEENSFDYSSGIIKDSDENHVQNACGVCLLNVDSQKKVCNHEEDDYKLTYSNRQYHSSCANLWVNCVNSLLPSLPLPNLL